MSAAVYDIIAIRADGTTAAWKHRGAPGDDVLCTFGHRKKAQVVARYFPSRKGWLLLDIRNIVPVQMAGRNVWRNHARVPKVFATVDGAIMYAIAKLSGHSNTA